MADEIMGNVENTQINDSVSPNTDNIDTDNSVDSTQNTSVENQTTEQKEENAKQEAIKAIRVRYQHQDMEIPLDQAPTYIQKGLNYDRVFESYQTLQNDPRLSFVENLAKSYNMTPDEYIQAVQAQQEQAKLDELIQQNIPEQYAKEILENKRFRETYENQLKENESKQKQNQQYNEFLTEYPDIDPQSIPIEVWQEVNQGKHILDAYAKHENKMLKQELAALKGNQKNAANSPSSLTRNGQSNSAYFTKAQVEAMSQKEVESKLDIILQSQKTWK
jgi:hypothetical protein